MNLFRNDPFSSPFAISPEENILLKKLLLTHDPDGRRLDSEQLLCAVENIMSYTTTLEVHTDANAQKDITSIEEVGSQGSLGQIISKTSYEMLQKCPGERNLHARTMILFDLLGSYTWDAKVALILAAFSTSYGKFWLLMQLHPQNPLALSVRMLKQLPSNLNIMKPRLKALNLLVKIMVDVAKCIVKFEGLPFSHVKLDDEAMSVTKSYIYVATYWVTRSALACSSQITDLKVMKPEQVHVLPFSQPINMYSTSTAIAVWELSSLGFRMSSISSSLRWQVDLCHQQIKTKMHQKLVNLFQDPHPNNQEVLSILLASKDCLPLKNYSTEEKLGVYQLKDKVVILLISKPEFLPLEGILLLVQQTCDHPHHKKSHENYEIVWVPISVTGTWSNAEEEMFGFLSNSLPWYSLVKPRSLNSAVVNYIKQAWDCKDDPKMVVLDSQGMIVNLNALDMVLIWGAKAYPFSSSRETQLWEKENWTLQLLLGEIDPLLTRWVQEGRDICIYASNNLNWIRELNTKLKEIRKSGVQVEMVYVGNRNMSEAIRHILTIINEEMHSNQFTFTKQQLFWLRMESMKRSKLKLGLANNPDHILEEVSSLLDTEEEGGWAVIARGGTGDAAKLQGRAGLECLGKFLEWEENVTKLGLVGALRAALGPTSLQGPCNHYKRIPYTEGIIERTVLCDNCKRPMKKYVGFE